MHLLIPRPLHLKPTGYSHEQPVDTPIGSERPRSTFIEEVDDEDAFVMPVARTDRHTRSTCPDTG